jgi:hypothetical protein
MPFSVFSHCIKKTDFCQEAEGGAFPKTRLVLGNALGKAAKSPLFPINLRLLSQKLKFWESLGDEENFANWNYPLGRNIFLRKNIVIISELYELWL